MFEGAFSPPIYTDLYNFLDGAQDDIFEDSYSSLPDPSPVARMPVLKGAVDTATGTSNSTGAAGKAKAKNWYVNSSSPSSYCRRMCF